MGLETAVNPKTGEVAILVDNVWKPAESVAQNDKGEKAYLVGGKWLTDSGPSTLPVNKERGAGEELARQLGLTMRAGAKEVVAIPSMVGDALGLHSSEAVDRFLDYVHLPKPENGIERVSQDVAGAMAGTGVMAKAGQLMARGVQAVPDVVRRVGAALADSPAVQMTSAAAASGAAGTTREMGGGPGAQIVAGLTAGVLTPAVGQAISTIPQRILSASLAKSERTPFAQEGERLAQETGIDMTTGARTGNKAMLTLENTARQHPFTGDRAQAVDVKIANQAIQRVNTLADNISRTGTDPQTIGSQIESTVKNAALSLDKLRDGNATRDYGVVRQIAGDQPVIRYSNLTEELKGIIDQYKNVLGSDAQKIVSQARRMLGIATEDVPGGQIVSPSGQQLSPPSTVPQAATVGDAMKSRSFYGKAARGSGNVFEDISPDLNRQIATRLFRAINSDFDESASNVSGALRQALDKANGNYKAASQSLEFLEKSALGKLMGEDLVDAALSGARISTTPGEKIVESIRAMHPSTRKTSVDIISQWNPGLAQDLKAFVLRDALAESKAIPPSAKGASQIPMSFNRFVSYLMSGKGGIDKTLESYGFTPKEVADIKNTAVAMMRSGDKTGYNFSNTNVQNEAMQIAESLGAATMSTATGGWMGAARVIGGTTIKLAGKYIGLSKVVDAMASEQGRDALKTIAQPKASPAAIIAAFETLTQ